MNLKLILIVSLLVLIFTSLLVFGFISWSLRSDNTRKAKEAFEANNWLFYTNLGLELAALLVAGFLFIKR